MPTYLAKMFAFVRFFLLYIFHGIHMVKMAFEVYLFFLLNIFIAISVVNGIGKWVKWNSLDVL